MRRRLMGVAAYIPFKITFLILMTPLVYVGILSAYAFNYYRPYYENSVTEVPFDFYSLLVGAILSFVSLLTVYLMATQEKQILQRRLEACENQRTQERQAFNQNYRNSIAEFLATQKLEKVFNSELFDDLQELGQITHVEQLTGGYSGAQVYLFHRQRKNVPGILKVANVDEIKNESQKFKKYVEGRLLIGPNVCQDFSWGNYAGLESNLNWKVAGCDHLTFLQIYKECLSEKIEPQVEISTITQGIIARLFKELQEPANWWQANLINVPPPVNIYQEHYPFTRKFEQIDPLIEECFDWGRTDLGLNMPEWTEYEDKVNEFLRRNIWNKRKDDNQYRFNIVRACIHGDLNSRNILLEANRQNHNDIYTVGLVDFSHSGNGLTFSQTAKFIQGRIQIDEDQGHIATDFCRLEADIKFYLTDLNDEQDLRRAWIVENLLLEQRLQLLDWEELQRKDAFSQFLKIKGLSSEPKWAELTDASCWTENNARKFVLAWKSIKAIRDALREILERQLPQGGSLPMAPFYLALLQASLTMIYFENERFHNAKLQKLYLVLASGLLCEKLL